MPGRGFASAAALIAIALACLAITRKLERERRLLAKLRKRAAAGITLTELRRREFYEKPTQERKRKKAAAVKRHMKRLSRDVMRAPR